MAPNAIRKSRLLHGRGEQALDELARAHLDDDVADAPHPRRHEVEPEQARHQKVDVARAGRGDACVGDRRRVLAAVGALQHVVDDGARQAALGPRRVVLVGARVAPGTTTMATLPVRSASRACAASRSSTVTSLDACSAWNTSCGAVARLHRGPHRLGRTVAEGDAERHRQHDGEHEGPEDGRRLAIEAAPARQRELPQRRLRGGYSRSCLPVSATNTSSSVAWCVDSRRSGAPSVLR